MSDRSPRGSVRTAHWRACLEVRCASHADRGAVEDRACRPAPAHIIAISLSPPRFPMRRRRVVRVPSAAAPNRSPPGSSHAAAFAAAARSRWSLGSVMTLRSWFSLGHLGGAAARSSLSVSLCRALFPPSSPSLACLPLHAAALGWGPALRSFRRRMSRPRAAACLVPRIPQPIHSLSSPFRAPPSRFSSAAHAIARSLAIAVRLSATAVPPSSRRLLSPHSWSTPYAPFFEQALSSLPATEQCSLRP